MTNELLTAAKDKAAREYGRTTYKSVQISVFESNSEEERLNCIADLDLITNRAMEIYAEIQRELGIREGFEAAREIDPLSTLEHGIFYPTVDDYLNKDK